MLSSVPMTVGSAPHFGLLLPTSAGSADEFSPEQILEGGALAEEAGFDAVWVTDHLCHGKPIMEPLTTMAMVLSRTQRVMVGTSVLQLATRPLAIAAKAIASLAAFRPGRVQIGIGVGGEYPVEWEATGVPLRERGARTSEGVPLLRRLLAGETIHERGRFNSFSGLRLQPSAPQPVPLLLAGRKRAALIRAATMGDGWIGAFHTASGFARDRETIIAERTRLQLPLDTYSFGMLLALYLDSSDVGSTDRALAAMMGGPGDKTLNPKYLISGTPATIGSRIQEFLDSGCTNVIMEIIPRGKMWNEQLMRLSDILPALSDRSHHVSQPIP